MSIGKAISMEDAIRKLMVVSEALEQYEDVESMSLSMLVSDCIDYLREKQLEKKWYTGTPTEEGWYLVAYECVYECRNKGKLEYHTIHIFADELGYKDIRGRASDDVWKAVAWQKIEPYKEEEDGQNS